MTNNKTLIFSLVLFSLVLLINILIRSEVLFNETLIADDLIYLPLALINECIIPGRHPIDYNFICHIVGSESVLLGRGIFLAYISLISVILFLALISFKLSYFLAFLASVSIFAGIPFLSQGTFITGSYPTHGLFFIVLALFLTSRCLTHKDNPKRTLLYYFCIFILFTLAGIASTSLTLSSFIIAPCAVYAFAKKKKFILWTLISLTPSLTFTILQFTGAFSNHYKGLAGWITFSLERMLRQVAAHKNFITTSIDTWGFYCLVVVITITAMLYIYHSIQLFIEKRLLAHTSPAPTNIEMLIILIGISLVGFATSLLPTLFVQGVAPRYTSAPLFFVFCLVFILLQFFEKRYTYQFVKFSGILAGLVFTVISVTALEQQHYNSYHKLSVDQQKVKSFLSKKSIQFAENAQILIFFNDDYTNFTVGFNHWSTHFARMATGRSDITAIIGSKSGMTHDPFTGEYSNHGKQYWETTNGRAKRKRMVGLDEKRPIYIYSMPDQKNKTYDCITIFQAGRVTIYNADESGAKIKYQSNLESDVNKERPSMANCIFYLLDADTSLPIAQKPTPNSKVKDFDGGTSEIIIPVSQARPPYSLSFNLKATSQDKISNSYTATSPPMPVLALPLAVYQLAKNEFKIGVNCKEQAWYTFKTVSDWTKVGFEVNIDGRGILYINDMAVKVFEECPTPKRISLGQGFKNRFWKGTISDFEYRNDSKFIN